MSYDETTRRVFLGTTAVAGLGMLATGSITLAQEQKEDEKDEQVTPAEDLMREHGVLRRVLLVYGEVIRRIDAKQDVPSDAVTDSANLVRTFVQDYHEKLEEDYLFPRFRKANQLTDLVNTLLAQHLAGRKLTEQAIKNADATDEAGKKRLRDALAQFTTMYQPHAAREDTVLFPAFRKIAGKEYDSLGEEFEKKENQLFGEGGFEKNVDRVAEIEKKLGIYELSKFTPSV